MRTYIAAPKVEAVRAREVARLAESRGLKVCSTWHRRVQPGDLDPADRSVAAEVLRANLGDLRAADIVILLPLAGEGLAVWTEFGRALERRKPVIVSTEVCVTSAMPIDWSDPLVTLAVTDEDAVDLLRAMDLTAKAASVADDRDVLPQGAHGNEGPADRNGPGRGEFPR